MGNPVPPDKDGEIKADIAAMTRDAGVWEGAAQRMADSLAAAQKLTFSPYDLSFMSYSTGLASAYQEIHQWTCGLLDGAQQNLSSMAGVLRKSASNYAEKDASGARSFAQLQAEGD